MFARESRAEAAATASAVEMLANLELGLRPVTTYEIDAGLFREFEG